MSSLNKISTLCILALLIGFTAYPIGAFASRKDPVIGRGSIVSKRVTLTRHHGMPIAHKLRVDAIRAKLGK